MKKLKSLLVVLALVVLIPFNVAAREKINVYLFKGATCGYCAAFLEYANNLDEEYKNYFNLVEYEVWNDATNNKKMKKVANYFGDTLKGVPYIVIGDKRINGFDEKINGEEFKEAVKTAYYNDSYEDIVAKVLNTKSNDTVFIIVLGAVIVGGIIFVALMSRETPEKEEPKKEIVEEVKPVKKTTSKKTSAKTTPKKTTTKKSTTTKKAPAKKTTKK